MTPKKVSAYITYNFGVKTVKFRVYNNAGDYKSQALAHIFC